jgi:hypothetical protein
MATLMGIGLLVLLWLPGCAGRGNDTGAVPVPAVDPATLGAASVLLVSGRIRVDSLILDPAYLIETRPVPAGTPAGHHRLLGSDAAGATLFELRFAATPVADLPGPGEQHFSLTVPLGDAEAERLQRLEVIAADGRRAVATARTTATELAALLATGRAVTAERTGADRVRLRWDAARLPGIMVRDPQTGAVLTFGRGGDVSVLTTHADLDVTVSDGVRSARLRVRVASGF